MLKHIVVLANSVKHDPGRCIAGREVIAANGGFNIRPWVRPVSQIGEGELYPTHFTLEDGSTPQIFDVITVHVDAQGNDKTQPENWIVSAGNAWKRIHQWGIDMVTNSLIEAPANLWLQPGTKADRVTKVFLATNPPQQSLYLLDLHGAIISRTNNKYRLNFSYNGIDYNLAITDPLIGAVVGTESNTVLPRCLACISLAPAFLNKFDGIEYHYKLAAMIIRHE